MSRLAPDVALPEDWEVVARHGNYSWFEMFLCLLGPAGVEPGTFTLRVRQKSTGVTYFVTAHNEHAAVAKIMKREFDHK